MFALAKSERAEARSFWELTKSGDSIVASGCPVVTLSPLFASSSTIRPENGVNTGVKRSSLNAILPVALRSMLTRRSLTTSVEICWSCWSLRRITSAGRLGFSEGRSAVFAGVAIRCHRRNPTTAAKTTVNGIQMPRPEARPARSRCLSAAGDSDV